MKCDPKSNEKKKKKKKKKKLEIESKLEGMTMKGMRGELILKSEPRSQRTGTRIQVAHEAIPVSVNHMQDENQVLLLFFPFSSSSLSLSVGWHLSLCSSFPLAAPRAFLLFPSTLRKDIMSMDKFKRFFSSDSVDSAEPSSPSSPQQEEQGFASGVSHKQMSGKSCS